jgi:ribonuclease HI
MMKWLKNFVLEREVEIVLDDDKKIGPIQITRGLMQGSALSPTLWTIHAAGLCEGIDRFAAGFADDFVMTTRHASPIIATQRLEQISSRFLHNCNLRFLEVRAEKCVPVLFTQRRKKPESLRFNDQELQFQKQVRLLGVVLDSRLTGRLCINDVRLRCFQRLNVVRVLSGINGGLVSSMLLTIYRGLIRSVVDYHAVVLLHVSEAGKKRMSAIETKGLRLALGALPGTANDAIYQEAGELPLDCRWKQLVDLYAARRLRRGRRAPVARSPGLKQHSKRLAVASRQDAERDRRLAFAATTWRDNVTQQPFWKPGEVTTHWTLLPGPKKGLSDETCRRAALEMLRQFPNDTTIIYTDGSRKDGRTGAAFWCPKFQQSEQQQIAAWCSATTGELQAIVMALRWLLEKGHEDAEVAIVTDSQAAISLITATEPVWTIPVLQEEVDSALRALQQRGTRVHVAWTPGHCGLEGNEAVDKLAKESLEIPMAAVWVSPTDGECRDVIKQHWQRERREEVQLSRKGAWRRAIQDRGAAVKFRERSSDVMWRRLRMGVVKSSWWRHRVLREGTGECVKCGWERGDLQHVLEDCPELTAERKKMQEEGGLRGDTFSAADLLSIGRGGGLKEAKRKLEAARNFFKTAGLKGWLEGL